MALAFAGACAWAAGWTLVEHLYARAKGDDEDDAVIEAHEKFTVLNDNTPEDYEQETVRVEVTP